MPAQRFQFASGKGIYSHVYNKGVDNRVIFNDEEDFKVFLDFLKDYLSAPADPENIKKVFTVKGRTFQGVPHQPRNYFNKVELIAYNLMPDHFHLLLHQKQKGAITKLMRSLCTRYSIYFNKKYHRTGRLFTGPYKSIQINKKSYLLFLTYNFHSGGGYSSYNVYLNRQESSWIKPKVVLSFLEKSNNKLFRGEDGYKNFIENYRLNSEERKVLESIILEREGRDFESTVLPNTDTTASMMVNDEVKNKFSILMPAFISLSVIIFMVLSGLGVRNISSSTKVMSRIAVAFPSPTPFLVQESIVAGVKDEKHENENNLTIMIGEEFENVNVQESPIANSQSLGRANGGEIYEYISKEQGWYQIKWDDGLTGFVAEEFVEEIEGEEN